MKGAGETASWPGALAGWRAVHGIQGWTGLHHHPLLQLGKRGEGLLQNRGGWADEGQGSATWTRASLAAVMRVGAPPRESVWCGGWIKIQRGGGHVGVFNPAHCRERTAGSPLARHLTQTESRVCQKRSIGHCHLVARKARAAKTYQINATVAQPRLRAVDARDTWRTRLSLRPGVASSVPGLVLSGKGRRGWPPPSFVRGGCISATHPPPPLSGVWQGRATRGAGSRRETDQLGSSACPPQQQSVAALPAPRLGPSACRADGGGSHGWR